MASRVYRWGVLLLMLSPSGCSPSADDSEPSPREVRKNLAKALAAHGEQPADHLTLTDFQPDGEHQYQATAKDSHGTTYRVKVTTKGRSLRYQAEPDHSDGAPSVILSGSTNCPVPPFDERHPDLMQWLRASLCALHTLGVLWPMMGRFGWRRRYSPTTERFLSVFALVNAGFALLWGYQYVNNLGIA